jgi:tripartite-type tricarboxylate transporter receptor subunit TctC
VAATVPGYDIPSLQGIFTPGKTPAPGINRFNQELVRALNRAEVKEQFLKSGTEATGTTPEEFGAVVNSQMTRLGKVIKDAGIRAE